MLDKVSFSVRSGEILGIAGVEGNGQKELVDMLFHLDIPNAGTATVNGENILGVSQRAIRAKGVSLVPEDRMLYGIASDATIEENMISDRCDAKRLNKGLLFDMKAIHKEVDQLIADYTVLCKSSRQRSAVFPAAISKGRCRAGILNSPASSSPTSPPAASMSAPPNSSAKAGGAFPFRRGGAAGLRRPQRGHGAFR